MNKITIIYDNESNHPGLKADWGFACLIEFEKRKILFDTGANGNILMDNMKQLGIDPETVDDVFLSHIHFDHVGGLSAFLNANANTRVFAPSVFRGIAPARKVIYVDEKPVRLADHIHSTGMLDNTEQSLALETVRGIVIVTGCSHPGLAAIIEASARYGQPYCVVGGLHGFDDFDLIEELTSICPTHCTRHIAEIHSRYPEKYIKGGAGTVVEI